MLYSTSHLEPPGLLQIARVTLPSMAAPISLLVGLRWTKRKHVPMPVPMPTPTNAYKCWWEDATPRSGSWQTWSKTIRLLGMAHQLVPACARAQRPNTTLLTEARHFTGLTVRLVVCIDALEGFIDMAEFLLSISSSRINSPQGKPSA